MGDEFGRSPRLRQCAVILTGIGNEVVGFHEVAFCLVFFLHKGQCVVDLEHARLLNANQAQTLRFLDRCTLLVA